MHLITKSVRDAALKRDIATTKSRQNFRPSARQAEIVAELRRKATGASYNKRLIGIASHGCQDYGGQE